MGYLPIVGIEGININARVPLSICDWWNRPCLFEMNDSLSQIYRFPLKSFRLPISERYKDMGTIICGKCQQGVIKLGDTMALMPNRTIVKIISLNRDGDEVLASKAGENLSVKLQGIEEDEVSVGSILCSIWKPVPVVTMFE